MEKISEIKCPKCGSPTTSILKQYQTIHNGARYLYICKDCSNCFSETSNTPMENLKTPISKVASALKLRSEGLGLRQQVGYWGQISVPLQVGKAVCQPKTDIDVIWVLPSICIADI
ncbi:MAG: hypothetical protein HQK63_00930 [Desulfamplus sp.]|nr:hypothetical protein [Desulfamplus sp.]